MGTYYDSQSSTALGDKVSMFELQLASFPRAMLTFRDEAYQNLQVVMLKSNW